MTAAAVRVVTVSCSISGFSVFGAIRYSCGISFFLAHNQGAGRAAYDDEIVLITAKPLFETLHTPNDAAIHFTNPTFSSKILLSLGQPARHSVLLEVKR